MKVVTRRNGRQLTGREVLAYAMLETAELLPAIVSRCKALDLLCYHTYDSRKSEDGYLDCTIVGHVAPAYFWELKREGENPQPKQQRWLDRMAAVGLVVAVRRPSDLISGLIDRELMAISRHGKRGQR